MTRWAVGRRAVVPRGVPLVVAVGERQQFRAVPCLGGLETVWGVILPLAVPVLAVITLISYVFTLNEFVIASFVLQTADSQTLIVGLHQFIADKYAKNWGPFAAGVLLTAIAPTALFFALQRYIVEGLTGGAVKG